MTLLHTDQLDVIDLSNTVDPLLKHQAVFSGECLYMADNQSRFQLERMIMQEFEDTRNLRNTQYRLMQQRLTAGTFGTASPVSPYLQKLLQHHDAV